MKKISKKDYQDYLNEMGTPEDDKYSNGGRVPDSSNYGDWMRKNDPIAFEVGYQEHSLQD